MSFARLRLLFAATIFISWLSWLGYLAAHYATPVIIARTQAMVASDVVVATIADLEKGQISIEQWLHPMAPQPLPTTLELTNLDLARSPDGQPLVTGQAYLMLIVRDGKAVEWSLASQQRSPGHDRTERPVIYPWNPALEASWRYQLVIE